MYNTRFPFRVGALLCGLLSVALFSPTASAKTSFSQGKSVRTLKQTCDELRGLSLSDEPVDPIEGAMVAEVDDACLETTQSKEGDPGGKPDMNVAMPSGNPPSFYGSPKSVRMKMLSVARSRAKLGKLELDALSAPEVSQPELAKILVKALPDIRGLQGGYVQDQLILRSLGSICESFPNLRETFPQACGKMEAAGDVDPLLALRVSLLIDSVNFPGRLALQANGDASGDFQAQLRLFILLVEASLRPDPLTATIEVLVQGEAKLIAAGFTPEIAARTVRVGGIMLRLIGDLRAFPGATNAQAVALIMNAYGDFRVSAELKALEADLQLKLDALRAELAAAQLKLDVSIAALDGARIKTRKLKLEVKLQSKLVADLRIKLKAEARASIAATLPAFNAAQIEAAGFLATYVLELGELSFGKLSGEFDAAIVVRKMELLLGAVSATFTLLEGKPLWSAQIDALLKVAITGLKASLDADLKGAHLAIQGAGKLALDADLDGGVPGVDLLFRLAMAKDMGDLRALALSLFVDVGPWAGDIIFGANIGAMTMPDANGNLDFAADATLGYAWDTFGFAAKGGISGLTLELDQRFTDTERYSGGLEGWAVSAPGKFRFEGRFSWEGELFDTISAQTEIGAIAPTDAELRAGILPLVFEETRLFNRALVMGAFRYEPSLTLGFYFGLGGGMQHENYDSVRVPTDDTALLYDENIVSGTLEGRLRFQWVAIPEFFALRFMSDTLWAGISLEAESIEASGASNTVLIQPERTKGWRLESLSRVFFDVDALAFLGLTPSLAGGADMFAVNTQDGFTVTFMPTFQFGFRATLF